MGLCFTANPTGAAKPPSSHGELTMNRRLLIQAIALAGMSPFWLPAVAQTAGVKRRRVVIQVSDNEPAKWALALNNARNLQDDVGTANVDIEIIGYGPGVNMFKAESTTANRLAEAIKAKVKVLACENSMKSQKLTRDDMSTAIGYVPAGVTHIIERQSEGWAYLRP